MLLWVGEGSMRRMRCKVELRYRVGVSSRIEDEPRKTLFELATCVCMHDRSLPFRTADLREMN
jgi:hypothetical protein